MLRNALALAACVAMLLATAPEARAEQDGSPPMQVQLGLLSRHALPMEHWGGLEVHLSATVNGFGMAFGAGGERFLRDDGRTAKGAYALWIFQTRPLEALGSPVHRWVDLHLGSAVSIGAVGAGSGAVFRSSLAFTGGLDVRVLPTFRHLALTAHYRYELLQRPTDAPNHLLLLGLAYRVAGDER